MGSMSGGDWPLSATPEILQQTFGFAARRLIPCFQDWKEKRLARGPAIQSGEAPPQ